MTASNSANRPRVRLGYTAGLGKTGESAGDPRSTVRRLLSYLHPYARQLSLVAVLALISTGLGLAGPILIGEAIDKHIVTADLTGLSQTALLLLAVYLGNGLISFAQGMIMVVVGQRFITQLRSQLFNHIQTLSMAFHDQTRVGDLMSRVSNDTEAINQALSNGLIEFTTSALLLVGIMIAMLALNWQLAIGTLTVMPLMLIITGQVTKRSRAAFREVQRNLGTLSGTMEENIAGLRIIKAFARESDSFDQFLQVNKAYRQVAIRADIMTAILGPMFVTMSILTIAAVALLGGWLALREIVEVGVIVTFVVYIRLFFRPMRAIAMLYNQLQAALAGAERIFVVLDTSSSVEDQPDAQPLPKISGLVQFEGVSFGYQPDKLVLEDINLKAAPGQTIALVGPTGAGKTTIINLLSRFYDVTEGAILIDGHNIDAVQQMSLRAQLGIVLQETFLFSGTVIGNIRYGRLDATDEEVIAAAKLANADSFIRHLPQGYYAQVSEQGHNFSQGQRQLLAIARAILADPRILILDEATSSVDSRTEVQIQEALLRLMEGRTAFVIAHRLSTIRNADLVLVVNNHRIIERGTHDQLLAQGGFYHDLYMNQFRRVSAVG